MYLYHNTGEVTDAKTGKVVRDLNEENVWMDDAKREMTQKTQKDKKGHKGKRRKRKEDHEDVLEVDRWENRRGQQTSGGVDVDNTIREASIRFISDEAKTILTKVLQTVVQDKLDAFRTEQELWNSMQKHSRNLAEVEKGERQEHIRRRIEYLEKTQERRPKITKEFLQKDQQRRPARGQRPQVKEEISESAREKEEDQGGGSGEEEGETLLEESEEEGGKEDQGEQRKVELKPRPVVTLKKNRSGSRSRSRSRSRSAIPRRSHYTYVTHGRPLHPGERPKRGGAKDRADAQKDRDSLRYLMYAN